MRKHLQLAKKVTHRTLTSRRRTTLLVAVMVVFASAGYLLLSNGRAATYAVVSQLESAILGGNAAKVSDSTASGGTAVKFGGNTSTATPTFSRTTLVSGLNKAWDMQFISNTEFLYTQRPGQVGIYKNGAGSTIANWASANGGEVLSQGPTNEGGLMAIAVDPDFATNRSVFFCMNTTDNYKVKILRFRLNEALNGFTNRTSIVEIPGNSNTRHSGCRIGFGPDNYLYITSGEGQLNGTVSQSKTSLNGKILRVTRDGAAAPDNLGGGFDARVFSYGHRNPQGLAFFPSPRNGVIGVSAEHGSTVDDELNLLKKGNFGFAARSDPWSESGVPMTDTGRYPDAVRAIWSSGGSTIAPGGVAVIKGYQWKGWDGAVVMGVMKAKHIRIFRLNADNTVKQQENALQDTYGRIRSPTMGPDGNLYITTDNGGTDQIIRLTPNP